MSTPLPESKLSVYVEMITDHPFHAEPLPGVRTDHATVKGQGAGHEGGQLILRLAVEARDPKIHHLAH